MSNYPLIIFEGIEGSGKSTQIKKVANYLKKKKRNFIQIREPGGSENSEKIRKLILNKKFKSSPTTDLLLYMASRNENIEKIILKNYKKKIILIDRFIYSSVAYQHYGMGISKNFIDSLNKSILRDIKPDLIFLHTINSKNLKKRIGLRKIKNRYDRFSLDFYSKVQRGFKRLLIHKKNCMLVNSNDNIKNNTNQIIKRIEKII